jgi:hypothetical protein
MTSTGVAPRKLNIHKIRVALKTVYKDIYLIPSRRRTCISLIDIAEQNESWTLVIVTASLLIHSGAYHQAKCDYRDTKDCAKLVKALQEAIDGICASVSPLFTENTTGSARSSTITTTDALLTIWPLAAASVAYGITDIQRRHIQAIPWRIGEMARIPKALSLVVLYRGCV